MDNTSTAIPRLDLLGPIRLSEETLDGFVAHECLPIFPVDKRSATIPAILNANRQIIDLAHAPKTPFKRLQSKVGDKTYNCTEKGVEEPISVEDQEVLGGRADYVAGLTCTMAILRARENAAATGLTDSSGTFAGRTSAGAAAWDAGGGLPLDDVANAKDAMAKRGIIANAMVISGALYTKLQKNAQIRTQVRAILGYNSPKAVYLAIDPLMLANVFGLKWLYVANAIKDTAIEGQNETLDYVWPSTKALVFRRPERTGDASLTEVALGRTFLYDPATEIGDMASGSIDALRGFVLEEYRDETVASDVIRAKEYTDLKILNADAGHVLTGI